MRVVKQEHLKESLISLSRVEACRELVRLAMHGSQKQRLQIRIGWLDQLAVSAGDRAHDSKIIAAMLNSDDPITDRYTFQDSYPGIDQANFEKFARFEVELNTWDLISGDPNFVESLLEIEGVRVGFFCNGVSEQIEISHIHGESLVLTDDLIEATQRYWKAAATLEGKQSG